MKLKIYSNSIDDISSFARNCCYFICDRYRDQLMPSSFKRNDALSRALGYKSHSDLVNVCKGNTAPESNDTLNIHSQLRNYYDSIALEFVPIFRDLSHEEIYSALTSPAPKQTKFELIEGTPIVQFSPLDDDISNELRESREIEEWWNVPFIMGVCAHFSEKSNVSLQPFIYKGWQGSLTL